MGIQVRLFDNVKCNLPFMPNGEQKAGRVIYIDRKHHWFLVEFEGKGGTYRCAYKMNGDGWNGGRLMPPTKSRVYDNN